MHEDLRTTSVKYGWCNPKLAVHYVLHSSGIKLVVLVLFCRPTRINLSVNICFSFLDAVYCWHILKYLAKDL